MSVVKLLNIKGTTLEIENIDVLDGTPLLDIKPYIPEFDINKVEKSGWFTENSDKLKNIRPDDRFK